MKTNPAPSTTASVCRPSVACYGQAASGQLLLLYPQASPPCSQAPWHRISDRTEAPLSLQGSGQIRTCSDQAFGLLPAKFLTLRYAL